MVANDWRINSYVKNFYNLVKYIFFNIGITDIWYDELWKLFYDKISANGYSFLVMGIEIYYKKIYCTRKNKNKKNTHTNVK